MTYCVGLRMKRGLVFMSDTRTNAGVDNISMFRKMFTWTTEGERVITLLTAGNLATTQALVSLLDERAKAPKREGREPTILEVPTMFQAAKLVGETLREIISDSSGGGQRADSTFSATVILGGQIKGSEPRLFMVYPEGNFLEASEDTPFFQIGETKYGRPILIRAYDPAMSFEAAIKLLLVSFDSTIKANLSVGMPLDVQVYERNALTVTRQLRVGRDAPYYQLISHGWGEALRQAFESLPEFEFPEPAGPPDLGH
ncbi:MAG: proteasome-type protease [Sandaracinaceae bacterium]|jgi:putative proteasome-type protease|nr:proteasome-type protease [Sandaracinaceae bacterium]MBP7681122.1 proteasome-type protease [Deltaproteobacteria bacterium]MBK6812624.1 proteasome-type protease [Sandaracinaceae bacterium]MBK7155571.1 proteasome-type protease [Sandaracinaceae bacterium]MBK7777003.1 proteasome-type protease [Sandaracinaceae bacterium]